MVGDGITRRLRFYELGHGRRPPFDAVAGAMALASCGCCSRLDSETPPHAVMKPGRVIVSVRELDLACTLSCVGFAPSPHLLRLHKSFRPQKLACAESSSRNTQDPNTSVTGIVARPQCTCCL